MICMKLINKSKNKKKSKILSHIKGLGFTNRLAIYILCFLAGGLLGGFYLALRSINTGYTGALYCWTIVFTPIGTATSIAISKVVDKSKAENTEGGIKYRQLDLDREEESSSVDSPPI